MTTDAHIQIHFPTPGEWGHFLLTALWQDAEGYSCRRSYHPEEIPAGHLPTLQAVVASLVGLGEPWQATHVVARLSEEADAVELCVNARRADGASRSFTGEDYPQLRLQDAAAIHFFTQMVAGES